MELVVENMSACHIAYIRSTGPYGVSNVQTMEELKKWAKSNNLINDESIILGIAQDNPETTEPENCRYDACIVITNHYPVSENNVSEGNLAGGKYVVFKINHTAHAVQKAWVEVFPELLRLEYQLDPSRPIIERYTTQMVNNHFCEICVPIY